LANTDGGGGPPGVVVTIEHHGLGEKGSFAIVDGKHEGDGGRIGENAMTMLLANIETDGRRKELLRSTSSAAPGAKAPCATISRFDPEEENEMRRVFEEWWDKMMRGDASSFASTKKKSDQSNECIPMEATKQSPAMMIADITEVSRDTAKPKIGEERAAGLERMPPGLTKGSSKEQQTKANSSALAAASCVKENNTSEFTSTSAVAAKGGDDPSAASAASEERASSPPSQMQKKKRKAPGPILIRAGGGIGGGRKKKKGKITIGKAV